MVKVLTRQSKRYIMKTSSEDNYDSDSFKYESASDTPPLKRGKRAHVASSDRDTVMDKVTGRAAFKHMTEPNRS